MAIKLPVRSPFATAVIRDPSKHAHDVQYAHAFVTCPFFDGVAETDIAIQLIPRLARPFQVENLLMQIDHVRAQCDLILYSSWRVMADVDEIDILLDDPV